MERLNWMVDISDTRTHGSPWRKGMFRKRGSEQNSKCLEFEVRKTTVRQAKHIGCRPKEALTLRPCPALAWPWKWTLPYTLCPMYRACLTLSFDGIFCIDITLASKEVHITDHPSKKNLLLSCKKQRKLTASSYRTFRNGLNFWDTAMPFLPGNLQSVV